MSEQEPVQGNLWHNGEHLTEITDDTSGAFEKISRKIDQDWKLRGMKLLTKKDLDVLPRIGATEKQGYDAIAYIKLFTPDSSWTWWITECDPSTGQCFGLVEGFEKELGYFDISEIAAGPVGVID